jgi:molybdopterin synthase catalytic subunit
MRIRVQETPFDPGQELTAFSQTAGNIGAVVSFTGVVRNTPDNALIAMEIEHYPGMTQSALETFAAKARARWPIADALIVHRYGRLAPGDVIMMVATAAAHRSDAFEAAQYLMDYLKSRAPFWKREITRDGAQWVDAKDQDETALSRW